MRAITEYIGPVFNVVDGKPKFIELPDRKLCTNEKCKHHTINYDLYKESFLGKFCPVCGDKIAISKKLIPATIYHPATKFHNMLSQNLISTYDSNNIFFIPCYNPLEELILTKDFNKIMIYKYIDKKCLTVNCSNFDSHFAIEDNYCTCCGVKLNIDSNIKIFTNYDDDSCKKITSTYSKDNFDEVAVFLEDFDFSDLERFKSIEKTKECFNFLESFYGEGTVKIKNAYIRYLD